MQFVGHTTRASRRTAGRASFSLALTVALLCAAFVPLGAAQAAAAPTGRTSAATAAAPGQLKAVIVVGPTHSSTSKYLGIGETLAQSAEAMGMDVRRIFHPNATAERLLNNIQGANFVAYLGHGNGWPSPYAPFQEKTKNGMGLNPYDGGSASNVQYYGGNWFRNNVRLADNAVVLLRGLCYAEGNGEPGMGIPSWDVARQRVDNFAAAFLFIGAGAVFAFGWQNVDTFIPTLMTTDQTIDQVFMTPGKSASPLYGFIDWDDRYFDSERMPGNRNHLDPSSSEGYLRAVTGRLNMTTADFRGGQAPEPTSTPVPPPTAPQGFSATAQANGSVQMAWQASTAYVPGTVRYRVFRNGNAIGSQQTELTYTDTPAAGTHKYKVRAIDSSGVTSTFSTTITVAVASVAPSPTPTPSTSPSPTPTPSTSPSPTPTPTASTGPTVPKNLAVTDTDDGVKLTWQASTSNAGGTMYYRVFRNGNAIGTKGTALTYTDVPASAGTFKYKVRAIDSLGYRSAFTPTVSIAYDPDTGGDTDTIAPSAAKSFSATALGSRRVGLSWLSATDNRAGTITYDLFRGNKRIAMLTGTSFTDRPRYAGTYTYWVRAIDAAGNKGAWASVQGSAVKGSVN